MTAVKSKRHRHSDHCSHEQTHSGFDPGPPSRSSAKRRAIHAKPERNVPGRGEPIIFAGAHSYQFKGPISFAEKCAAACDGSRNKFLSSPGLSLRWIVANS